MHYEVLRKAVAALAGRERRETMDRWIARLQKPDGTLKGLFLVHRNLLDEDRSDDLFAKHIQSRNINYYQMWAQMGAPLGRERLQGIADGRNPRYPDVRQAAEKMLAAL